MHRNISNMVLHALPVKTPSSLRTRLSYEFGHRIACGETVTDIALENPMGLLVVGQKALEELKGLRGGSASANVLGIVQNFT